MRLSKRDTNYAVIMLILSVAYKIEVSYLVLLVSYVIGVVVNAVYDAIQESNVKVQEDK